MKEISSSKGYSILVVTIIVLIFTSVSGYFAYNYLKSTNLFIPTKKFEDPQKRFSFKYNSKYFVDLDSNESRELSIFKPIKLTRNVTLKREERKDVIYEIKLSLAYKKPQRPTSKQFYVDQFNDVFLIIESEINPLNADYPLPDENIKEIEDDLSIIVKSLKVSNPLQSSLNLKNAKTTNTLIDGYLIYINDFKTKTGINEDSSLIDPMSYLAIIPNLDEKLTQENISILAKIENPNRFGFTIYNNNIYFDEAIKSLPNSSDCKFGSNSFKEQEIYKINLNTLEKSKLFNNNLCLNGYIRGLSFFKNKMYYISNSVLYEYDLIKSKTTELKKLPKKQNVNLGEPNENFAVNTIDKIEDNKIFAHYNTCSFGENHQGGCNPGEFDQSYNLENSELKDIPSSERFVKETCTITKIEKGKLIFNDYPLTSDNCQKIYKNDDSLQLSPKFLDVQFEK